MFSSFSSQGQQHAAIHLRSTHAIPMGWRAKPQRDLFLQFTGSIIRIHLRLTPTIPMQSKMWLAGGTSTCSLPSVHGVDNTHTSTLDTYNTHAIKNVAGRRNFNVLSSLKSANSAGGSSAPTASSTGKHMV